MTREYALRGRGGGARGHGGAAGGEGGHRSASVTADAPARAGLAPPPGRLRRAFRFLRARRASDFVAWTLVAASAGFGGAALFWIARHALAVQRLTRRRRRHDVLLRGRPSLVPARRAAPRRPAGPDRARAAPRRGGGRGPPLLPPPRPRPHRVRPRRRATTCGRAARPEGGSTLTQQLARTLFLSNQPELRAARLKEAVLAVLLEELLTKDQILELYLNRVYLSGGVYGVDAMARSAFAQAREGPRPRARRRWWPASSAPRPRCRPGATGTGRATAAAWCCSGCARRATSAARRSSGRRPRACASRRARAPRTRGAATRRTTCAQLFRERVGDDHPADWQVHTTFLPAVQAAAEAAVARGLRPAGRAGPAGGARRARPADGRRAGARRRRRLRAVALQPRRAQPAPARLRLQAASCTRRRSRAGCRRSPCSASCAA